jgi:malonyl-CoA decarboxylase
MASNFLGDLMQTISDRGRRALNQAWAQFDHGPPPQSAQALLDLCEALLSRRGEASGVALAKMMLNGYRALPDSERFMFLNGVQSGFGPDERELRLVVEAYATSPKADTLRALQAVVEPRRQELIRRLNQAPGGTEQLVAMRRDLLRLAASSKQCSDLDADFVHLFSSWFNRGFLVMRQINWDTPARILEKIIRYEAVHAIRDWDDLRDRIEPEDRRLFAFFHPRLVDEPLIFVEVALTRDVPHAIAPLLARNRSVMAAAEARTAVFYSISNCQDGLRGISFGHFLIKQVAEELQRELPDLEQFVTLSPVPHFARWLAASDYAEDRALASALADLSWIMKDEMISLLRPQVERAAARYFMTAKRDDGQPVDPVARFHLGNGASLDGIHWPADFATAALSAAHGLMVNYRYDLSRIEANHEAYAEAGTVMTASSVRRLLSRPALSLFPRLGTG